MKRIRLYFFGLVAVALVALPLQATDFIRGDANGDGVVSISDAHFINVMLFLGGPLPECDNAADADSNGTVQLTDAVRILDVKFLGTQAIGPPFPNAGPDPDPTNSLGCVSYGHGSPLDDPAAKMQILNASAFGGTQRRAVITIAVSSTGPIGGYSGTIVDEQGVLEMETQRPIVDRAGLFDSGFNASMFRNGRITFALLWSLGYAREFPAG